MRHSRLKQKLANNLQKAWGLLESCSLCPRRCGVNRLKGQKGLCNTGLKPKVYSFMPHHGEEPPISGKNGSGTIFFSFCNMNCVYCQNYEFSQLGKGKEVREKELAGIMLELKNLGCHNINLVSPTHIMPQILKSLEIALEKGLDIPIVYNTGGYELPEVVSLLDGIIDIYLADMRYADNAAAIKYSGAPGYPEFNRQSIKEMYRQTGAVDFDDSGIMKKGLIIRHLVLPDNASGTAEIMRFISQEVSADTYISLMSQYYPCYRSGEFPEINRRISRDEYRQAQEAMEEYGMDKGWIQESFGLERFAGTNIKAVFGDEKVQGQE